MVYFYGLFFIEVFFLRILFIQLLKKYRKSGFNYRNVIIIGSGNVSKELQDVLLKDLAYGYRVLGHFSDNNTNGENSLGGINDAINYIKNDLVHEVYFTLTNYKEEALRELVNYCENNLIRIKFIPDFQQITRNRKISIDFYDSLPVVSLRKEPLEAAQNRIVKRVFDFLFSLGIILLVFPWLFPVLMILIKCGSKGPIFFVQHRSGENNRSFSCLKFRTMRVNTEADELQASKNDVRITGIGKFLRKTNLDELPQFFNVLIGDMSVVGPRPHMLKHTEDYSKLVEGYLVRHFTRPGITGWAQVNGFRGETKELDQMKKRVEYDVWYIENWSFLLDVKIIFNTIFNMASGEKNAG
jgi:undecaprenyl-phosphate galactose phosphotransferase/putative colanic acid biosynthesis UDP-glucose lipid carrier transferase